MKTLIMDEYKKPYLTLFNAVTDALGAMEAENFGEAKALLIRGQAQAEEAFIRAGEPLHPADDVLQ